MNDLLTYLRTKGCRVVESEGPPDAPVVIVGEALGENEVIEGRPFCGPAGWMLDSSLRAAGLRREQCFITNVVPIRPRNNDLKNLSELGLTVESFYPLLKTRLETTRSKCIIALGNESLKAVCGLEGITDWRGSILQSSLLPDRKVIPSFHPSFILRQGDQTAKSELAEEGTVKHNYGSSRASLILDLKKAKTVSMTPETGLTSSKLEVSVAKSYIEAVDAIGRLHREKFVSFDIETRNYEAVCIAFSADGRSGTTIPLTKEFFDPFELSDIRDRIARLLWTHRGLIAQNGTYDITILFPWAPVNILHFDTMLAHHFLYSELPHSLAFLTSIYTNIPFYKWMGKNAPAEQLFKYNAIDAIATWQVAAELKKELAEAKLENLFYGYAMPLLHTTLRMGWRGVKIDQVALEKLNVQLDTELLSLQTKIDSAVGHPLNVRSSKQMKEFLYNELKLPVQTKRRFLNGQTTYTETADEEALKKLAKKSNHPAFPLLLQYREKATLKSSFAAKQLDQDGRWRCTYSNTGTKSGRLSSKKTLFGTGSNLQNIPRVEESDDEEGNEIPIKEAMVADEGKELFEYDKKQAEARLVALFANDAHMLNIFATGKDIHRWNASILFNKREEDITKDERYFAKRIVHAFDYGLGPQHLVDLVFKETGVQLSRGDAERLRSTYLNGCPALGGWHRSVESQFNLKRWPSGILVNPFGFRRIFMSRPSEDLFRKAYAQLPQSTCVMDLNMALIRIDCRLPLGAEVLLQVHDSIVGQSDPTLRSVVDSICMEELNQPLPPINGITLTIPVDRKVGPNWGSMKEW